MKRQSLKVLSIKISPEFKAKLKIIANKRYLSYSDCVRMELTKFVEAWEKDNYKITETEIKEQLNEEMEK